MKTYNEIKAGSFTWSLLLIVALGFAFPVNEVYAARKHKDFRPDKVDRTYSKKVNNKVDRAHSKKINNKVDRAHSKKINNKATRTYSKKVNKLPASNKAYKSKGGHTYGKWVNKLPKGHKSYKSKHGIYFNIGNLFYRKHRHGYIVVRPPLGAIVLSLPLGYITLNFGSRIYYRHHGIYYWPSATGYIVVEPPTSHPDYMGSQVSVMAEVLNVRSGPGKRFPVISQVYLGEVMDVHADSYGWIYVKTASGIYGWVMSAHTTSFNPDASG